MTPLLRITNDMLNETLVRELMLPLVEASERPEHRAMATEAIAKLAQIMDALDVVTKAASRTLALVKAS